LGVGNFLRGVSADIQEEKQKFHREHIRRLAEVAHIFLDAGLILIITVNELSYEEQQLIKLSVNPSRMNTVCVGDECESEISYDMFISDDQDIEDTIETMKEMLREQQVIFRPF
jgi:bifunctional enzyme CysN/CysC